MCKGYDLDLRFMLRVHVGRAKGGDMSTTVGSREVRGRSRLVGGLVTVIGAGLMGGMVFAPWLGPGSSGSGPSLTGWDLSDLAVGARKWFIGDMFDDFSPFFPGLIVLVVAAVLAAIGVGLLMATRRVGGAAVPLRLVAVAAFVLLVVNALSVIITGPGADIVFFEWGLIGSLVGTVVALVGIQMATRR
jgi:hypothetical protein